MEVDQASCLSARKSLTVLQPGNQPHTASSIAGNQILDTQRQNTRTRQCLSKTMGWERVKLGGGVYHEFGTRSHALVAGRVKYFALGTTNQKAHRGHQFVFVSSSTLTKHATLLLHVETRLRHFFLSPMLIYEYSDSIQWKQRRHFTAHIGQNPPNADLRTRIYYKFRICQVCPKQ